MQDDVQYASTLARAGAYGIDMLIGMAGVGVTQALLYKLNPLVPLVKAAQPVPPGSLHLWVFATVSIPLILFYALTLSSGAQATPGMRLMGIHIAMAGGELVPLSSALLRSVVMLVPFELNHVIMFHLFPSRERMPWIVWAGPTVVFILIAIWVLPLIAGARHQGVHDHAAGTVVLSGRR
jgi:uncharacterized RDD family membrane protein YckC